MTALEALRDATTRMINENPVGVSIHRVLYITNGAGGRTKQESNPPIFTGRLVPSRARVTQSLPDEAGGFKVSPWTLIAPWDADLRAGSDVQDTFVAAGRSFRVARVMLRGYQGETYAAHAVLEEVS